MDDERATLLFSPSAAEILQADFPGWLIWREFKPEGEHGDWCARRHTSSPSPDAVVLRHTDLEGLRELLENHEKQQEQEGRDD
ncbi:hypothetical protein ACWDWV_37235 [Streptosporangium sandarakinum]